MLLPRFCCCRGSAVPRSRRSELPNPLWEQQLVPRWEHCASVPPFRRFLAAATAWGDFVCLLPSACPHPLYFLVPRPHPHPEASSARVLPCCRVAPSRAMAFHALQKRLRGLFSDRRQQSPSSSPSGQPCATTSGAAEHREKVQGRLHRAAARGDLAWLRRWRWYYKRVGIDPPDQQRRTPLHLASANGHADVIRYLAGKNCKLNVADNLKRTPLMRAVQCQQKKCVAALLEHGADPNLADADGNTALHLAVLSGNTTVAGLLLEHNASSDAENQEGYTPLNLVSKQHEEMLECLLRKAGDGYAAEQCERAALAVTTSHEADVEEENLRLQEENLRLQEDKLHLEEELEKVKVELQEMEEKYLNSERCVQNLMAALEEKDRQEVAATLELEDQLSAYVEYQTTVKQLEEHMLCLEIQNARLEATVQQQSNRTEDLQRDHQASASLQEMEEKYLNSEHCVQNLMAALDEKDRQEVAAAQNQVSAYFDYQTTVKQLEEHVLRLEIQNARLEATIQQQNDRFEALQRDLPASASLQEMEEKYLNSERCVQNLTAALEEKERETTASAKKLQDQVLKNLETVKQLQEEMQRLGFEKTCLEATVQQQSSRIEALQRERRATTSAQAASQERLEHIKASHHASRRNQLKDRIGDPECELNKIKNTPQDGIFPEECAQAEVEEDKELYPEEVKTRRCLAKKVERQVHIFWSGNKSDSCFLMHLPSKSLFSTCSASCVET
ncbi:POTE ankyrin domain family member B-like [Oenanthe melanoleuca]|uniref:POTE ankyrin domain family member B-like n=1 Tax=Oenanthe melanoleuca TaxID=2939378 RepID=UPI0024C1E2D7|nr:POTE ankyrin domain family member B-like [Oenanthe melanoleuca]